MDSLQKRLRRVIDVIRLRDDWRSGYNTIEVGEFGVEYFDTKRKSNHFSITYDGIEVSSSDVGGPSIDFPSWEAMKRFDMEKWLSEVESLFFDTGR